MGCTCSTAQAVEDQQQLNSSQQKGVPAAASVELPQPLVFGIIRTGHEVIRARLKDIERSLVSGDLDLALAEWKKARKWFHTHLLLELGNGESIGFLRYVTLSYTARSILCLLKCLTVICFGFFPLRRLLDEHCDNISTKENFFSEYEALREQEESLNAAFETDDMFQIKASFYEFKDPLLLILEREDDKLMPCIDEMAERKLDLVKLMRKEIMQGASNTFGFEAFVRYALGTLEKHDGGLHRVRTYGLALWAVATHKEWKIWATWVEQSISPASMEELEEAIAANKKGKRW